MTTPLAPMNSYILIAKNKRVTIWSTSAHHINRMQATKVKTTVVLPPRYTTVFGNSHANSTPASNFTVEWRKDPCLTFQCCLTSSSAIYNSDNHGGGLLRKEKMLKDFTQKFKCINSTTIQKQTIPFSSDSVGLLFIPDLYRDQCQAALEYSTARH